MARIAPRIARYAISVFVLLWAAIAELSVIAFGYSVFAFFVPWLPQLDFASVASAVTSPLFLVLVGVAFVGTAALGRARYGSLAAFVLAVSKRFDNLLSWSLFDEPLVTGRLRHDDVAWRLHYWNDDRIEVAYRECPFCGLELVESYLPRHVVNEPNTSFAPGEGARETAAQVWHDVFGTEKVEDTDETLALSCPQCNFSVPGRKDLKEGRDGARAKFRKHIDSMTVGNPRRDPFAEYAKRIRDRTDDDPTPAGLWDEYVSKRHSDDLLRIGIGPNVESDSVPEQSHAGMNRPSGEDRTDRSLDRSEEMWKP